MLLLHCCLLSTQLQAAANNQPNSKFSSATSPTAGTAVLNVFLAHLLTEQKMLL
jgi:hypothetical protein